MVDNRKDWVIFKLGNKHNKLVCEVCKAEQETKTIDELSNVINDLDLFLSKHIKCIKTKEGQTWRRNNK